MNRNTVLVWSGPSRITGDPVGVFLSGVVTASRNAKTGDAVQSWILRLDVDPVAAVRSGEDAAICGGCMHRGARGRRRTCYVQVHQAPLSVYRSYRAGRIRAVDVGTAAAMMRGRVLRIGSYGDPAAVPVAVWRELRSAAVLAIGYTHQFRSPHLADVVALAQVSADCAADAERAHELGVGSFRVLAVGETPLPFETLCPSSSGVKCVDCGWCAGGAAGANVAIPVHGAGAGAFSPRRVGGGWSLPTVDG
jgi:hypothetical protein